jgi:LacI family transcriptional regulator
MADVAKRAGVSKSTVSLVLNNKPTVSPALRQAVLKAATDLDYRLPTRRSVHRSAGTKSIVAVHYERHDLEPQFTSILLDYVAGIQSFARDREVHLTFVTDRVEEEHQLGYELVRGGHLTFDGAILMGWSARRNGKLLHLLLEQGLPVVALSRDWPELPISTVGQDHRQQACTALDHLIGLGHQQIAFVASKYDEQEEWFEWRRACYERKMSELCGGVDRELIVVTDDCACGACALLRRRRDVTALFCVTDPDALAVVSGAQGAGYAVPGDVSVIGLDGATTKLADCPQLTTVAWPHFQAGYLAGEALLQQIENGAIWFTKIVLRSELIEGETCAPPAAR